MLKWFYQQSIELVKVYANHITMRRGVDSPKVKQRGHDKIKTFGVGRTASADFWKTFIRQLVSSKYLKINIKKYGALQITETGADILELDYF